jgi:hypothetical protein
MAEKPLSRTTPETAAEILRKLRKDAKNLTASADRLLQRTS